MYTFDARIRYSETDANARLTIPALIDYFQDCSTFQSEDLGVGLKRLKEMHLFWVVSSWQIEIMRLPENGERVTVGTFPYLFKDFLGNRNFFMQDENGNYLAKANSIWTLIDTDEFKLTKAPQELVEAYEITDKLDMNYAARKIRLSDDAVAQEPFVITNRYLDANGHVNNGQYIHMAADYMPKDFEVSTLRVEYKKQAFLNATFYPFVEREDNIIRISFRDEEGKVYANLEVAGRN